MKILWTRKAKEQLDDIFQYIAEDNPNRALLFVDYLQERAEILLDQPELGIENEEGRGDRRLILGTHPYSLFYKVIDDTIYILRVKHDAQLL